MADPVVGITNGVPTSGTGTITTLGQTLLDGANITQGAIADAAVTAGATGSISAKLRSISRDLIGGIVLQAGAAIVGLFKISDGTNTAAVKAASTAPVAADPALVVSISPNSVNVNGRALPGGSAPVVLNSMTYQPVAASTTQQCGASGATGDYLDGVLIIPGAAAAGVVQIKDGAGGAITIFAGGGTTALPTLAPFYVPIGAISSGGVGGWKVITNANVTAIGVGNFT